MREKIKLMSIGKKKPKNLVGWSKTVERYAPDMYDLLYGVGEGFFKKSSRISPRNRISIIRCRGWKPKEWFATGKRNKETELSINNICHF